MNVHLHATDSAFVRLSLQTLVILGIIGLLAPIGALADDNSSVSPTVSSTSGNGESTIRIPDKLKNKEYKPDEAITDTKLQADAGSLSRYSVKFNLSYNGPVVNDVTNKMQPNIDGGIGVYETSLGGSIGARYRLDSDRTISFGTGISALTPFQGIERLDVNNPFISYDTTRKFRGIQFRSSPGLSLVTVPNYKRVGEFAGLNWDFSAVKVIADSRWATTLDLSFAYYIFTRDYRGGRGGDGNAGSDNIALYPGVKYNVTDRLNVSTSLAFSYWSPRAANNLATMWNRTVSERLGLGWAIRRDIYFYPFLNMYPSQLAFNTTTVNFLTVFSIL